jgi:hypothetical protein
VGGVDRLKKKKEEENLDLRSINCVHDTLTQANQTQETLTSQVPCSACSSTRVSHKDGADDGKQKKRKATKKGSRSKWDAYSIWGTCLALTWPRRQIPRVLSLQGSRSIDKLGFPKLIPLQSKYEVLFLFIYYLQSVHLTYVMPVGINWEQANWHSYSAAFLSFCSFLKAGS